MKITILEDDEQNELEIIVKCKVMSDDVMKVLSSLRSIERKVLGTLDGKVHVLPAEDIYYFESVDKKNFAYTRKEVYEIPLRLYQIETMFGKGPFFRATKATIINLDKISTILPRIGGRLEVTLENGEQMMVSRQYVSDVKNKLGF
ncbi:LytTR family DNA-binding domain-containing protein [Fictibacillus aquaticus]|uniref:Histidine kinase n=1 Tax=Fictibacillus aquaticus TaxID=2021314 RepID=A0A235F5U8_9BACL|nr:LytTR family DNA-binding domain-containing protein [Fictibacillus aquaticus]OYD56651.1 histidine kinase [Fictibacillus aquaticus]